MMGSISKELRLALAVTVVAFGTATATVGVPTLAPITGTRLLDIADHYFPKTESTPPKKRLYRLTRDQIDVTVKSLLPQHFSGSVKDAVARDPVETNYEYAEHLKINQANFGALTGWIGEIAGRVRKNPAGVLACAGPKPSDECLATEARRFVIKAFRGDAAEADVKEIVAFFQSSVRQWGYDQAVGDLVELTLNSPHFLFRKELPETASSDRVAPAQLLQTLTYTLADVPPDKLGYAGTDAGPKVKSPDATRATVKEILAHPDARAKLVRFFKAWLEVREPADFRLSREVYPDFNPALATAMVNETTRFLQEQLSKPNPSLKNITQTTDTFVSKPLEPIYAVKAADPLGRKAVALNASQRFGIFTQPAVLASHSGPAGTQPIKRGVFFVRKVMCMEMEPPPKGLDISLYEGEATTERKRIEMVTKQATCAGCHKLIDPFGFFLESYDALGTWRMQENGHAIDPKVSMEFFDEGPVQTSSAVEALKAVTSSVMFKQCFVRQLFRFYMGRSEENADHPLLHRMFVAFAKDDEQNIAELLEILGSSDRMMRRK